MTAISKVDSLHPSPFATMFPTLDILMAVYNNAEYIGEQLESLIGQSYPHFHIIARDDCSSDNSVKIIQTFVTKYPGKITLIQGKKNLGARGNFSALLLESQADYLMFCDADDIWLPTKVEETLSLIQKNESIYGKDTPLLIHSDLTVVDKHLNTLSPSFWHYSHLDPKLGNHLNRLLPQNVMTGCTMLINRPLIELSKPIPTEAIMHDWWIGLVAAALGRIDFLAKPTLLYRQHGKNDTGAKNWRTIGAYWDHFKKATQQTGRNEMHQRLQKTMTQAALFLQCYGKFLSIEKQILIASYAALADAGPFKKRYLLFKYRFFKNTLAKTLAMFFLI